MSSAATKFTVEWLQPSHGPHGTWYRADVYDDLHMANAKKKSLIQGMREYGLSDDKISVRVRRISGRAPAMTPNTEGEV
jgi:hypothetical protein